jgi:hypothetical protein
VNEPITGSLDPYTWDSEAAVAYEVAIEAINGVVGAYSALIHDEEQRPEPDGERIAELRRLRTECQRERERINPDDATQVAEIRQRYSQRLRGLRSAAGDRPGGLWPGTTRSPLPSLWRSTTPAERCAS